MKKTSAGKSEPKKETKQPRRKQKAPTVVKDGTVEPSVSRPTMPVNKRQRGHHGTKPRNARNKPKKSYVGDMGFDILVQGFEKRLYSYLKVEIDKSAKGDSDSFKLLLIVAMQAIAGIWIAKEKQFDMVNDVAKVSLGWPIIWLAKNQTQEVLVNNQISELELGADVKLELPLTLQGNEPRRKIASYLHSLVNTMRLSGEALTQMLTDERKPDADFDFSKRPQHIDRATKSMYDMLIDLLNIEHKPFEAFRDKLRKDSVSLPKLSDGTVSEWFDVAWDLLLKVTDGHPEENDVLAKIGKAGEKKTEKSSKKGREKTAGFKSRNTRVKELSDDESRYTATQKSDIQYEIRRSLKNSFKICCGLRVSPKSKGNKSRDIQKKRRLRRRLQRNRITSMPSSPSSQPQAS